MLPTNRGRARYKVVGAPTSIRQPFITSKFLPCLLHYHAYVVKCPCPQSHKPTTTSMGLNFELAKPSGSDSVLVAIFLRGAVRTGALVAAAAAATTPVTPLSCASDGAGFALTRKYPTGHTNADKKNYNLVTTDVRRTPPPPIQSFKCII